MTIAVAILVFGALLGLLALGTGLLVERAAGWPVPGALLAPVGVAGMIIVSQLTTLLPAVAPVTPIALALCAAAGFAAGAGRLRELARAPAAMLGLSAAAVAAYALVCAPVLLAGRVTQPAYLLDTTAAIQMAGADWLVSHGRDFSSLADSGYKLTLEGYFGTNYPAGAQVLLGAVGRLVGGNLVWLYHPFVAVMLALCVPSLYLLARAIGIPPGVAAIAAIVASAPALVYAYALMGSIKEITLLPLILALAALLVGHGGWIGAGVRAYLPVVLVAAAGLAVVGVAFAPWVLLGAAIALVVAVRAVRGQRPTSRRLALQAAAVAGLFALAALPTLVDLAAAARLATGLSQGNDLAAGDPGNLVQRLHALQAVGVWLHGSHRVDPPAFLAATYAFIGAVLVAAVLGLGELARRRAWTLMAFVTGCGLIWLLLTIRGTDWTDAKLLVLVSPLIVLVAFAGAGALLRGGHLVEGGMLVAVLAGGVLWSDALAYHDTNLAPTARLQELSQIGERFAGAGPALLPDFDEYALYLARRLDVNAPGFARKPAALARTAGGDVTGYGHSYDLDDLSPRAVRAHPLLVLRRSPEQSHPPTGFRRAFAGRFYEVWRRVAGADAVLLRVPGGRAGRPAGRPSCSRVRRAAARAGADGVLRYRVRPPLTLVDPRRGRFTSNFSIVGDSLALTSVGNADMTVRLRRGGRFSVWLRGDFTRATQLLIDGRVVGEVAYESGGEGNYATPLHVRLEAGRRQLRLRRLGASWRPGDGAPARIERIVLEPAGSSRVVDVDARRWRSVCATDVDWVEAIRRTP